MLEIRSERLILRPVCGEDVDVVLRIHSDPRTYQHRPDLVMRSRGEAVDLVNRWVADWEQHNLGYFAVCRDGEVVGFAGTRVTTDPHPEHLNLYYRFSPDQQGHGYAFEAATAALGYAERRFPHLCVWAVVAPNNPASIGLAKKLGLHRCEELDISPGDLVYVR